MQEIRLTGVDSTYGELLRVELKRAIRNGEVERAGNVARKLADLYRKKRRSPRAGYRRGRGRLGRAQRLQNRDGKGPR